MTDTSSPVGSDMQTVAGKHGEGPADAPMGSREAHTPGRGNTWRIDLPLTKPLSLNDRQHWRTKAKAVAALRHAVKLLAPTCGVPALQRAEVVLHYAPRDARRRDRHNLVATLKPCVDGLVDARVLLDDTPEYLTEQMPVIEPPTGRQGQLWLTVREVVA